MLVLSALFATGLVGVFNSDDVFLAYGMNFPFLRWAFKIGNSVTKTKPFLIFKDDLTDCHIDAPGRLIILLSSNRLIVMIKEGNLHNSSQAIPTIPRNRVRNEAFPPYPSRRVY